MEELTFDEMESEVFNRSVAYQSSSAFRSALGYVANTNPELYKELIRDEYNEAFS